MKTCWIDCETTGTNSYTNGIIQIGLIIDIDGVEKLTHNFYVKPADNLIIDDKALEVSGITREQIKTFETEKEVYEKIKKIFDEYVDPYDKSDKFLFAGYNCRFDLEFMYNFWKRQNDNYFFSYFSGTLDVKEMVSFLSWIGKINKPLNYKLSTIAEQFGIKLDAHDALDDIKVTREIAYKLRDINNNRE